MSKINWSTRVNSPVKTLSTDPGDKTTRTSRCLLTQLCANERMIFRGSNNATVRRRRAGSLLSGTCVNNRGATGGPRIPARAAPTMIDLMASISTVNSQHGRTISIQSPNGIKTIARVPGPKSRAISRAQLAEVIYFPNEMNGAR